MTLSARERFDPQSCDSPVSTLAEVGLVLTETKTLLSRLQASMLCGQVTEYAAHHRVCAACKVLQSLKDRRTRGSMQSCEVLA